MQKEELLDAMRRNTIAEEALSSKLKSLEAQMELQKENNSILQKEFELKHSINLSLKAEIENLRQALTIKSASEPSSGRRLSPKKIFGTVTIRWSLISLSGQETKFLSRNAIDLKLSIRNQHPDFMPFALIL